MEQLALGKMQTLEQVEEAVGLLRQKRGTDVYLDLAETPKLSSSAMQLLVSARKTWAADGKALAIRNLVPEAQDALELAGLAGELEKVAEAHA